MNIIDRFFQVSSRGSTISTEIRAGFTTFVTMAYILPVNMSILTSTGLDGGGVFMATALSAVLGTVLMGLLAGLPFALAPGMGLNAFFAYTIVLAMGYPPQFALAAVLVEGLLFVLLSLCGIRTHLLKAIPAALRLPITAGIGLFIMAIGLQNAGIVVSTSTAVTESAKSGGLLFNPSVCLALAGIAITVVLWLRRVRGALLLGMLFTWFLGMLAQLGGWYVVDPEAKAFSLLPSALLSIPPSLAPTFGLCFSGLEEAFKDTAAFGSFAVVTLTLLYVDIFDTLGGFTGVMTKARLMDENGDFPNSNRAFLSDALATVVGAVLGTSTVTTFAESAAGVEEGGRTGLTSIIVALLFLASIFFFPVISAIPGFATAPALIVVGIMMCEPMSQFDWQDTEALIPGVMTIIYMVVGFSVSDGIMWGFLAYLLTKSAVGKYREPSLLLWILGILFALKMILLG